MSFLPDVYQRNRKPLLEGRGIKVFRTDAFRKNKDLNTFLIKEGWGPEDILSDMLSDRSIRRLFRDIKRLIYRGTSLNDIANNIEHLEDKASTRLTTEEKTVLLKHIEKDMTKNPRKWKGRVTEGYSAKQIASLRKEYSAVNKVDPDSPTYKSLIKHLDSLPQELLKDLANAKIKFVSSLARNRVK